VSKQTAKGNLFCLFGDLHNEADVEALFVDRLLNKLRYPDNKIQRKKSLETFRIGRGSKKESYKPDYVLLNQKNKPVIVIDAKSIKENPQEYQYQVSGYALSLNQKHEEENPVKYNVLTNGKTTFVYSWDQNKPILKLSFDDFEEDNAKFINLRSLLSYGALDIVEATESIFQFDRPAMDKILATFDECHNIIWKKEKKGPTVAFREFAKIMFIKLREDHRISQMIAEGRQVKSSDFNFCVSWINEHVEKDIDDNPVANILFTRVRDLLEEQINTGKKKRIFRKDETLQLGLGTILEVVRRLEHMNLHGIDEDLNGRMFETFLNATVRGKELGQFFTPRSIVKYMTLCAGLKATPSSLPFVLDGCCGSCGFLIEAMSTLVHQIDNLTRLTDKERKKLKNQLYEGHLWGIDANEDITQIARLNMYLHGDGGSKIFHADSLDKTLAKDKGWPQERQTEHAELSKSILKNGMRYDVVLTNPPFSMSYKRKDKHEARVLEQYQIAQTKIGKPANSVKSNVLFLERYYDLLNTDGQLITVIDNSVLNGDDSQEIRNWILDRFIIKQVVSLPFNTFFRAQANVQTSILHLKRKENGELQGDVFMGILNNIGHDDHQRSTPERDNTGKLWELWQRWYSGEKVGIYFEKNIATDENLGCPFQVFIVSARELSAKRLDAFYYAPELKQLRAKLQKLEAKGLVELKMGKDFALVPAMKAQDCASVVGQRMLYFEIGDVTQYGAITNHVEDFFEELPTRARLRIKANDVVFAKNNSSRGTTVIIPDEFDNQLVTTGFIGIRPRSREEALLLWSILESEIIRKQIYYLAITAVQPEIREEIFRSEFIIPVPKRPEDKKRLIDNATQIIQLHDEVRGMVRKGRELTTELFDIGLYEQ
jgi:type I restriction enzyme M protein